MHTHWRDCQAWRNYGLPLSTTSNEAAKLYDAAVTQYIGLYNDKTQGGLRETIKNIQAADPSFVMGLAIGLGLECTGSGRPPRTDDTFHHDLEKLKELSKKDGVTEREKKYVVAVEHRANGQLAKCAQVFEDILLDYPNDILALKFAQDNYFLLGQNRQMRDSVARVLPQWNDRMPLHGYVYGMYAFGLEECNQYKKAENYARKGFGVNPYDTWSSHALCHVFEMEGRTDEGLSFMNDTVDDWKICDMLACHNYWHWALFHIEKGEYEEALGIFDAEVGPRGSSGHLFPMTDYTSLLWRFRFEGVPVGNRWDDVVEVCRPHVDDHTILFEDIHMVMTFVGAQQKDDVKRFMKSLREYIESEYPGDNSAISRKIGAALCEAFIAYDEEDYGKVVDLLLPGRYEIQNITGSHAQKDVFYLLLVHSAIQSHDPRHHKIARSLINERKQLKPDSKLEDRLYTKALSHHINMA